jgi:hypothetical protein
MLYWRVPSGWRPAVLAAAGAALAAWGALLAWLALICGPRWRRPALARQLGLAGLLLAFALYQYAKAWHALAAYLGFAFLLRTLPAPLANCLMALWSALLLAALWLAEPLSNGLGFRYAQLSAVVTFGY